MNLNDLKSTPTTTPIVERSEDFIEELLTDIIERLERIEEKVNDINSYGGGYTIES